MDGNISVLRTKTINLDHSSGQWLEVLGGKMMNPAQHTSVWLVRYLSHILFYKYDGSTDTRKRAFAWDIEQADFVFNINLDYFIFRNFVLAKNLKQGDNGYAMDEDSSTVFDFK